MKPEESINRNPQWSQKLAASGKWAPQRGQACTSKYPQCLQKFAPERLGVWQEGQFISTVNYKQK